MFNMFENFTMTINGLPATSEETTEVINPATEEIIAHVPSSTADQLDQSVECAQAAFQSWRNVPVADRQKAVSALGDLIEAHADHFKQLLTLEQGKARAGAEWEIGGSVAWCHEIARQSLEVQVVEDGLNRRVETRRVPIGVVAGITPWNFPLLLAIWKIAPALVSGNTIIIKPSPFTPLCTLKLGELARDIFPPGAFSVLSGGDALGRGLTEHRGIRKISFTGSTETGRKIMESAAGNLKRITLELGGNDPAIVLADVDPRSVAKDLFWAAFQNSAQFCVAAKRIYIHEDIYEDVKDALVDYAKTIKVGDGSKQGTDLGPIQNRMQFEKLKLLFAETKAAGARFALGGEIKDGPGFFVPVTIVDNPPDDSRVVSDEAFGPILPLLKFSDTDEVVRRANDTPYGLAASIWAKDITNAQALAERIEAGTVWINEAHVFGPHIAFGGHKQSGMGLENALEGLAEYTNPQTITVKKTV